MQTYLLKQQEAEDEDVEEGDHAKENGESPGDAEDDDHDDDGDEEVEVKKCVQGHLLFPAKVGVSSMLAEQCDIDAKFLLSLPVCPQTGQRGKGSRHLAASCLQTCRPSWARRACPAQR